jgi:hypothetical protein
METAQMPWSDKRKRAWDWRVRFLGVGPMILLLGLVLLGVGVWDERATRQESVLCVCAGLFNLALGGWAVWLGIRGPRNRTPPDGKHIGANDGADAKRPRTIGSD